MIKLTARQAEVLSLIKRHIRDSGLPPTRADIAKELGFKSANAAEEHLRALAKKGAIEIIPGTSRGIRITAQEEDLGLPIIGQVAAGNPILAEQNIDDHVKMPEQFFSPTADYLLRVRGESMKNIGIMDGDLLAVHSTSDVREGQVVVARIDDEVTVKRLKYGKNKRQLMLLPENEEFEPIIVDLADQEVTIEGISVGVIRRH
ncbi:SOS-response transcriptional repressor LexA [Sinobacterium caligoides]|uniref:LexA repressor n=1 Tax=Sinobacterium caligoides TaxID=933926 RepID=A0A3N2DKI8_9GAMM|nr:transcriptional repressor LexA [Sinobacterium caligoides]ROS00307.1 SOS-response transcriptional repressor LexA [Sinobacterium caligoides]